MAIRGMAGVVWMAGAATTVILPAPPEAARPVAPAADAFAAAALVRGAAVGLRLGAGLPCSR